MSDSLRDKADHCFRALGASQALDLALDGNGMVSIQFQNGRTITFETPAASRHLFAHADILQLPRDPAEMALRALELNLFRVIDPLAWIAFDPETSMLTLCAALGAEEITTDRLAEFASAMLDIIDQVERRLSITSETADDPIVGLAGDMTIIRG